MLTIITKSELGKRICLDSNFILPSFNCLVHTHLSIGQVISTRYLCLPSFWHFSLARQKIFAQPKQTAEINQSSSATPHCTTTGWKIWRQIMLNIIPKSWLGKHICLVSNFLASFNCLVHSQPSITQFKSDSQMDISSQAIISAQIAMDLWPSFICPVYTQQPLGKGYLPIRSKMLK